MVLRLILIHTALPLISAWSLLQAADGSTTVAYWRFEQTGLGQDGIYMVVPSAGMVTLEGGPSYHRPDASNEVPLASIPNPDPADTLMGKNERSVRSVGPRDVDGQRVGADFLVAESVPELNFNEGEDFTIEGWIKLKSLPPLGASWHVVSKYGPSPERLGYAVMINPNGQLLFRIMTEAGGQSVASIEGMKAGQWTHFAARRSSQGDIDVYLDGKFFGSEQTPAGSLANTGRFYLGTRDEITLSSHLDGWFDEIRISSRLLQPEEFLNASQ